VILVWCHLLWLIWMTLCIGSINCRVGHAFFDWHHSTACVGWTSCGSERGRLWHALHCVGVRRSHHQGLVHVNLRVCSYTQRTQAWHCLSTISWQTCGLRQLRQHYTVCCHYSLLLCFHSSAKFVHIHFDLLAACNLKTNNFKHN